MFSKNLKYYRLKKNMTKSALADSVGVSAMAITNYENGNRKPDMLTIKKMAKVLGVRVSDFLSARNENLSFVHSEFRKKTSLSKSQQEYICESVEEYFGRFYDVVEILGGEVLPKSPTMHGLTISQDIDSDGLELREYLGISQRGPVGNLIELLENNGILVFLLDIDNTAFDGMNGSINGRPYIVVNKNMTPERIRTTLCHEIAHFAFQWPKEMTDKEVEKRATGIAGAFLFPKDDAIRELGIRRTAITTDMLMVCKEYGISMSQLVVRSYYCGIIGNALYQSFFKRYDKKKDSYIITDECATLFEQLVYRAVNEREISIQKGAELLEKSYDDVAVNCCHAEV